MVRQDTFTVKTYQCQADGSIKLHALMQHLQEVAAVHAEELGFGYTRLNQINSYWVLSNFRIEIGQLPRWNDEVTIRTWPSGVGPAVATREFIGTDRCNREIFKAGSEWMVLDRQKNRPKNLLRLRLTLPENGPKALAEKLNRLEPRNDYSEFEQVRVPYSSIDLNGHVNNTEYVRWGIDSLRRKFQFRGGLRSVQVTYLSEVFEGDEIDLLLSAPPPRPASPDAGAGDKGEHFYVLGKRSTAACAGVMSFPQKRERPGNVYLMELGC